MDREKKKISIQDYWDKVKILIGNLDSPFFDTRGRWGLSEYDVIISQPGVFAVNSTDFIFDFEKMLVVTPSTAGDASLNISLETCESQSVQDVYYEMTGDYNFVEGAGEFLIFFYRGWYDLEKGSYSAQFYRISFQLLNTAIRRYFAIKRLENLVSVETDPEMLYQYVSSGEYTDDKAMESVPVSDILQDYYLNLGK